MLTSENNLSYRMLLYCIIILELKLSDNLIDFIDNRCSVIPFLVV